MQDEELGSEGFTEDDENDEVDYEEQQREDAAAGLVCSNCGTEYDQPHGFPVLCKDCWTNSTEEGRAGFHEATNPEVA